VEVLQPNPTPYYRARAAARRGWQWLAERMFRTRRRTVVSLVVVGLLVGTVGVFAAHGVANSLLAEEQRRDERTAKRKKAKAKKKARAQAVAPAAAALASSAGAAVGTKRAAARPAGEPEPAKKLVAGKHAAKKLAAKKLAAKKLAARKRAAKKRAAQRG